MELETVEDQDTIKMEKDTANPFNLKEKTEKELVSTHIPEDTAPVEEKEQWFMKDLENAPK